MSEQLEDLLSQVSKFCVVLTIFTILVILLVAVWMFWGVLRRR